MKKCFEETGYKSVGEPVEIQVLSDGEKVTTTLQGVTAGWSVETLQVYCVIVMVCAMS